MEECDYCGATFEDETAYLEHLDADHREALGAIDRRRVEGLKRDDGGPGLFVYGAALVGVVALGLLVYVFAFGGGGGDGGAAAERTPYNVGGPHFHGTIDVTIAGEKIDFSRPEYQNPREYPAFHFENRDGDVWHGHADGVTLEYAMATLGIEVTEDTVTFDGTTYRDADADTTVVVEVNGESVDPAEYVLDGVPDPADAESGDHVRIVVQTDDA